MSDDEREEGHGMNRAPGDAEDNVPGAKEEEGSGDRRRAESERNAESGDRGETPERDESRESAAEPALDDERSATSDEDGTDRTGAAADPNRGEPHGTEDGDEDGGGTLALLASVLIGLLVTALAYLAVEYFGVFFEEYPRVQPTVEDRGVGADWVAGNTDPALDAMIALVHAADVILGVFILVMVFIHWAAFRRLATRMRRPGESRRPDAAVADGGTDDARGDRADAPGDGSADPTGGDRR